MVLIVFGVIFVIVGLIMAFILGSSPETAGLTISAVIICFCGVMIILAGFKRRKLFALKKQQQNELAQKAKALNANWYAKFPHYTGLPIAENVECTLFYGVDKMTIEGANTSFTLTNDRIRDVTVVSEEEIHKSYTSSIGGAVGGAVLFGPIGAMIGGRTKEKTTTTKTYYLIVTYEKDGEIKYIGFDATNQLSNAHRLLPMIKANLVESKSVEL